MAAVKARHPADAIPCRRGGCPPRVTRRATTSRPTDSSCSVDRKASGNESITEEGPVCRYAVARENRGDEPRRREEGHQDLVAPLDCDPGIREIGRASCRERV